MDLYFSIVISSIGLAYFIYGKKRMELLFMIFGGVLMFYPYFVHDLMITIILGILFAVCPFLARKYF